MLSLKLSLTHRRAGPDPVTTMMVLEHAHHSDQSYLGDIIPLHQLHVPVQLIPVYSLYFSSEFFQNCYSNKEMFWALTLAE